MAEASQTADQQYGQVGLISYTPAKDLEQGPGQLHTTRFTKEHPRFEIVGPITEVYSPSRQLEDAPASQSWHERRAQRKWLRKSHPEFSTSDFALNDLVDEDKRSTSGKATASNGGHLLAVGQITSLVNSRYKPTVTAMACAAGDAGELLRISRLTDSQWQWDTQGDAFLTLQTIDADDKEDEVTWASDAVPISQIKFVSSQVRAQPVYWLIVQKQSCTTILQPEYHGVPVSSKQLGSDSRFASRQPSRIAVNPLLVLTHAHSNGKAHSDVAFNPGADGEPPQIAIIDEYGNWNVWKVDGRARDKAKSVRPTLMYRGHIFQDEISEVASAQSSAPKKHGIIFVGKLDTIDFHESPESSYEGSPAPAVASQYLVAWNRDRLNLFDLQSGTCTPNLLGFGRVETKPDAILDVQVSPTNREHLIVLTSRFVHWIDAFGQRNSRRAILATCPIVEDSTDAACLSLSYTNDSKIPATILALVFSAQSRQYSVYWFRLDPKTEAASWHHHVTTIAQSEGSTTSIRPLSMSVQPAKWSVSDIFQSSHVANLSRRGAQFFQCNILGEDLRLLRCICATFTGPKHEITAPGVQTEQTLEEQQQTWKRRRKQFLAHISNAFVLPDNMADAELESVEKSKLPSDRFVAETKPNKTISEPLSFRADRLCAAIGEHVSAMNSEYSGLSPVVLGKIQGAIERGITEGLFPLSTWREISMEVPEYESRDVRSTEEVEELCREIIEQASSMVVMESFRRDIGQNFDPLADIKLLEEQLGTLWDGSIETNREAEYRHQREEFVREIAREIVLETSGLVVQDVPFLGQVGSADTSEQPPSSSVAMGATQSSQPTGIAAPSVTSSSDTAFRRLQLLAPSLRYDPASTSKPSSVLSYWPSERGVDTSDYISSVAVASDRQFDEARQRLQRIEARRKAQAEKYKRPAFMRQGLQPSGPAAEAGQDSRQESSQQLPVLQPQVRTTIPGPAQIMSSQQAPSSSQTGPAVAMSQPVPGAYGDRKKVKKTKKKSGFR